MIDGIPVTGPSIFTNRTWLFYIGLIFTMFNHLYSPRSTLYIHHVQPLFTIRYGFILYIYVHPEVIGTSLLSPRVASVVDRIASWISWGLHRPPKPHVAGPQKEPTVRSPLKWRDWGYGGRFPKIEIPEIPQNAGWFGSWKTPIYKWMI